MLEFSRLVFAPGISVVAQTVFNLNGLETAVEISGAVDAAEKEGSPLNNLLARAYGAGLESKFGGNGDDLAEFGGRQCYRSWKTGRDNASYIDNVKSMGHGSVFEHASIVFQCVGISRSLTHELIRHRAGTAYSQESQRYVDAKDIRFVVPPLLMNSIIKELGRLPTAEQCLHNLSEMTTAALARFRMSCQRALDDYIDFQAELVELAKEVERLTLAGDEKAATSAKKRANEAARSLLPNAAETRILFTTNLRALWHILTLRGDEPADLEIRRFAVEIVEHARGYAPNFFNDLQIAVGSDQLAAVVAETKRV